MARFTNQAQLAYNNSVTSSNIAVGEILEVISATKTAVRSEYEQNERITYIISILNTGGAALHGMTVTDTLGAYTAGDQELTPLTYVEDTVRYYVNGILQNAPVVAAGPPLVISGISIPAGGSTTLVYQARVNRFAPLAEGASITNEATVSGANVTPVTARETVTAESMPLLTITKAVSPVPVVENGTLTYTFLIQNAGNPPATAGTAAVITDRFDPALTNLTVTFNGTVWSEHTHYTYDPHTGAFATIAGQVTVPAATYTQDMQSGVWQTTPGVSTLTVAGTI